MEIHHQQSRVYLGRSDDVFTIINHQERTVIRRLRLDPLWHHSKINRLNFQREIDALTRLKHPNIVQMISYEEADEGWGIINLEYIFSKSLNYVIFNPQFVYTAYTILHWCSDTLQALSYMHASGFVHRDIKPSNMLIEPSSRLILCDFETAKSNDPSDSASYSIGTMLYRPPEAFPNENSASIIFDDKSDMFSAGVTFWEMIMRRCTEIIREMRCTSKTALCLVQDILKHGRYKHLTRIPEFDQERTEIHFPKGVGVEKDSTNILQHIDSRINAVKQNVQKMKDRDLLPKEEKEKQLHKIILSLEQIGKMAQFGARGKWPLGGSIDSQDEDGEEFSRSDLSSPINPDDEQPSSSRQNEAEQHIRNNHSSASGVGPDDLYPSYLFSTYRNAPEPDIPSFFELESGPQVERGFREENYRNARPLPHPMRAERRNASPSQAEDPFDI